MKIGFFYPGKVINEQFLNDNSGKCAHQCYGVYLAYSMHTHIVQLTPGSVLFLSADCTMTNRYLHWHNAIARYVSMRSRYKKSVQLITIPLGP